MYKGILGLLPLFSRSLGLQNVVLFRHLFVLFSFSDYRSCFDYSFRDHSMSRCVKNKLAKFLYRHSAFQYLHRSRIIGHDVNVNTACFRLEYGNSTI